MKKWLFPLLSILLVLLIFAFVDFWPLPKAPGSYVEVANRKVHVHCVDPADGQVPKAMIWFESGSGVFSPYWFELQRRFATESSVRTCTYDRAGMGWSEVYPDHHNVIREGKEAYEILSQVDSDSPLILVGHSYGGATIRITAQEAGDRVKGMIYLDAATVSAWRAMWQREEFLQNIDNLPSPSLPWPFLRLLNKFLQSRPENFSDQAWLDMQLFQRMQSRRSFVQNYQKEVAAFPKAIDLFEQYPPPITIPSVYIAHSEEKPMFDEQLEKIWSESIQKEFGRNKDNFSLIVAEGGDHNLVWSAQDLVFDQILSMTEKVIK